MTKNGTEAMIAVPVVMAVIMTRLIILRRG
jgi:hypothetical protein